MTYKKKKGLSLAETLVSLLILSVIMAASMPLITVKTKGGSGGGGGSGGASDAFWEPNSLGSVIYPKAGKSVGIGTAVDDPENAQLQVTCHNLNIPPILVKASDAPNVANSPLMLFKNSTDTEIGRINFDSIGNIAVGTTALYKNENGENNTAVAHQALYNNITGSYNTAVGPWANYNNITGNYNIALGYTALAHNETGNYNTVIGSGALYNSQAGTGNTVIGFEALYNNPNGYGNVAIGNYAGFNESGNNTLYISNSNTLTPLIKGMFDPAGGTAGSVTINGNLTVTGRIYYPNCPTTATTTTIRWDAGGWLGKPSDAKLKDIEGDYTDGLNKINKLKLKKYKFKKNNPLKLNSKEEHVGVIAQDLQKIMPEAVTKGEKGYLMISIDRILWTMLNAIKDLSKENTQLKEKVSKLEERLIKLEMADEHRKDCKPSKGPYHLEKQNHITAMPSKQEEKGILSWLKGIFTWLANII
ncbi:MAG: tail fiber domain-containing protein [Candidatus Gastranaerophilaceae bacterium]|jgi:hypothetical protein